MLIEIAEDCWIDPDAVDLVGYDEDETDWTTNPPTKTVVIWLGGGMYKHVPSTDIHEIVGKINESQIPESHYYIYLDEYAGACACGTEITMFGSGPAHRLASHIQRTRES
jgi:hypothetical protein